MGTILGNPYEFNFAQVANAEFRSESSQTTLTGERIMLSCNSLYSGGYVDIISSTRTHPNPNNAPQIRVSCEGYGYPDDSGTMCGTYYQVEVNLPKSSGMQQSNINPNDAMYRNYMENFNPTRYGRNGFWGVEAIEDARKLRDAVKEHWDVFRYEAGCSDSKALNYSPVASTGANCPCTSAEPVWAQGVKPMDGNPTLQPVAEKPGDCSCVMPPENLDGHGYLVEEWSYEGTPFPDEYDSNPPYQQIVDLWEWKRHTGKSVLPQAGEEETIYAIAKKGWRATGLNAPQEFIVKKTLSPTSWRKYRLITATGFEKMGCMDSTAKNYDPEATVQPQSPTTMSDTSAKEASRAKEYECKYCEDDDENTAGIDPDTGKCKCKDGYKKGLLGKCKKDKKSSGGGNNDTPPRTPPQGGLILGGIVALTAVGLLTAATMGRKEEL